MYPYLKISISNMAIFGAPSSTPEIDRPPTPQ